MICRGGIEKGMHLNFIANGRFIKALCRCAALVSAMAVIVASAGSVRCSAEDSGEITIEEANVSFVPPEGWIGVAKNNMVQSSLDAIPVLKSSMENDFSKYHGYYYAVDSTRIHELYISSFSDSVSEQIFNSSDGLYTLISEYLNDPQKHKYFRNYDEARVESSKDRISAGGATFYIVEYTSGEGGRGICYSAVVNKKYINFDFYSKNGKISDTDKINYTNFMKTVKILKTEEREQLNTKQIIIIASAAFFVVILLCGVAAALKKKKNR